MTRLCPHVSLWLVAASVFTAAACSVDPLVITGRPCSEQKPCGQGATCDPTTLTCTKGGIADGGACPGGKTLAGPDLLFVSDSYNHRIRKITGGTVSTVAGDGSYGYRDGPAMQAWFSFPEGLAVGGDGVVYIVDGLNHSVRMLRP